MPLENNDLGWKHDPGQLMARYLDSVCYTTTTYKYRMHYEIILSSTGSTEFQHFYPTTTRKVYNFSKIIIKKILTPEEWGMSPLKERDYIHPEQKVAVKYNYWDYMDSFNKALLYENANKKHSWFIKICSNVFSQPIPNWFCKWGTLYGPSIKILPEQYKSLYAEGVDISPKLISMEQDNINNPKAWSNDHTEADKRIKEKVKNLSCLTLANPNWTKTVETDASDIGYGGVLTQYCPENKRHYIVQFYSSKWNATQKNTK